MQVGTYTIILSSIITINYPLDTFTVPICVYLLSYACHAHVIDPIITMLSHNIPSTDINFSCAFIEVFTIAWAKWCT